jgi:putative peptide zinc metalloprotease protein
VSAAAPRLRRDLTVSRLETASGGFLIVKHPVSGRFYRFKEAERFIAEQLDGETPLDVIRERTEEEFGASLSPETLNAFVQNLDKIGLLDTGKPSAKRDPGRGPRIRGNLLYLRFAFFDPDRLLARLVPRLRFFFTGRFLVVSALPILVAFAITFANAREIAGDLPRLYQASAILPFFALILVVASIHEFAHGLTCKHFGGEVHELGFMVMYFQPAFYCNVSDAWLFPEKSKRLWVGFAGPYLELVLWALATIAWRLTEPDTWINYTALIVMTLSGLRSFLDFNPFVKLDGYYLLSDLLELPNLRRRSFKYVGDGVKRLLGFGRRLRVHISQRERRIYLVYGLVATVSSLSLLSFGLVRVGGYLIDNHQPMALLLLVTYSGLRSGRRFRRLFGQRSGRPDVDDDGDVIAAQPEGAADPTATPEPRKKRRRSRRREITWGALAAAALGVLFLVHLQLRIAGPFTVLPEENADVRAAVEGIVEEMRVQEGDQVKAGDVIARLADKDVRAELLKTQAQVREARANLRKLQVGTTAESLAVANASVTKAEDAAKFAQGKLARSQLLFERQALSPQEFEAAQEQAATADNDLAEARSELRVLVRGNRPEEIEAARAQLDRLEAQQHFLETQLGLLDVVSPATGVVATPARELKEMVGQFVAKGALIAKVYAVTTVTGQIVITEKEIGDVHVGQQVALKSRAYPDMVFHGTVTTIATAAEGLPSASAEAATAKTGGTTTGVRTFVVTTQIDNRSGLLKPGMTGLAKVVGGDRRVVDLVQRRLTHTFKVEFWSWW